MPMPSSPPSSVIYPTISVSSWSDYRAIMDSDKYRGWGFRGHTDASWPLLSSLSRYFRYASVHPDAWMGQELRILRIFRRKAHLYLDHVPAEDDSFEWLGLMQHHGAPTRLLDVTWSPYVALFFAIERGAKQASVWAFNSAAINEKDQQKLRNGQVIDLRQVGTWVEGSYERDFVRAKLPFVIIGEPRIMNRRLIAQSGTFLVPSVLDRPVDEIISGYERAEHLVAKLLINVEQMREEAMYALYSMNITHATLFPDLDGLARSMAYELEFHWAFNPRNMRPYPGFPPPEDLSYWDTDKDCKNGESGAD